MRIAHIHWSLGTGGVETMLPDIMNEQAKDNDVALFVINDWVEDFILSKINKKVKVFLLNRKEGSKNPWPIIKLNLLLAKFRPDIIHTHAYRQSKLILTRWIPMVRTIHNVHNNPEEYPKYKRLFSISQTVADWTRNQGWDSVIVNNGIPFSQIRVTKGDLFQDNKLHFVEVSRLYAIQKAQDKVVKAIALLKKQYKELPFVMHFIGEGNSLSELQNLVKRLNVENYIQFEGNKRQDWLYENLCNFDLFIQPSNYEGFGLTVAEAIAAKLPVIISNIDGPREIIDNGKNGWMFEVGNVEDLANKIQCFLENGYDNNMIQEAYKFAKANYDVSLTAKKYIEEYKKIL